MTNNNTWMLDVLIDTIRFAEQNDLPESARALQAAFEKVSCELAVALPTKAQRHTSNNIFSFPASASSRH